MARSRWKLMAGVLGLSIGGLAAVAGAGVPAGTAKRCPEPIPVGIPLLPTPVQGGATKQAPLDAQAPLQIPSTPAPQAPVIPSISTPGEVIPFAAVASTMVEVAPLPRSATVQVLTLPVFEPPLAPQVAQQAPSPAPVQAVIPVQPMLATPPPVPATPPAQPLPAPVPVQPLLPAFEPAAPPIPTLPTPPKTTTDRILSTPVPSTPAPAAPAPANPPVASELPAPTVFEKKLKVMLHMGDERPRFEIRDGDEVYLKVVCDKVDVKSPVEKGETSSTLKASGKVTFITPGGDGVCDELTVAPGSGLVVVTGKVTFRYTWGKAETTVSGDKMTFRLGQTPGQTIAAPTTVPASYTRP